MPEPITPAPVKSFVGSTARTMLKFSVQSLGLDNVQPDNPLYKPLIRYTILSGKTAQLNRDFLDLPEVAMMNENIQVGLSKLKSIASDPTAKGINVQAKANYDLFSSTYAKPAEKVQQELSVIEGLRSDMKKLINDQLAAMQGIVTIINNAPSPQTASETPQVRDIFTMLEKSRLKIFNGLKTINISLRSSAANLNTMYKQIYSSIPVTERKGVPTMDETPRNQME